MPPSSKNQGGISSLIREAGQQAKRESRQAQGTSFVINTDEALKARQPKIFNILEFIESDWGLTMNLFPVQKFIVKLYYHLPLEAKEKVIEITDMFRSKVLHRFTEVEYLRFLYDEGRCNIREQDHERRELILAIGRRGGKCVRGDSLVLTDRGVHRIEDLGTVKEEGFSSASVGVVQEGGRRSTAEAFYNGGVKPTFGVRTESGYQIWGTGNHRIKVMGPSGRIEWRYLDEIKPGECVALNRTSDLWANELLDVRPFHNDDGYKDVRLPDVLDVKWGNLLGYLVGDGTWGDDHAVAVTVEHPETWEYVTSLFREVLGEPRVQMDERTANTGRLEVCSVRARRFLDAIGWKLGCARDAKMVPWAVLRSPKAVVCAFLRGLFETDGCAEDDGRRITFSSASFRLAHEVQVLLLNLGIVASVRRKWVEGTQKHYANLTILGARSRQQFARLIGFDSAKKRGPMLAALEQAQEGKSDTESIPFQAARLRDWLESIPKRNPARGELGWGRSKLREALGNSCKPGSREDLTYPRLYRALDVALELGAGRAETAHFEELLRLDYFFDPVVLVEESEDQVYDLTVPDGESFVANGMTNHNTTLSGIFASYEVYRLLNLYNPQDYYGLPPGNRIQIISVATDKDQASLLFNEVASHMAHCEYFKQYLASSTLSDIKFRTPYDIEKFGAVARFEDGKFQSITGKATIRVTFKGSVSRGLRGAGNIVIILDEMAHYQEDGQSGAKQIYDALSPSKAAFSPKNPENPVEPIGPNEGRIICISSPLNRAGKFYDLFHTAMKGGEAGATKLAIQAPTWEINPTVSSDYYRSKYYEDPATFETEHGANFSDRVRGWIERESDLLACVDTNLQPVLVGVPKYPHQLGLDLGVKAGGDGTCVCITYPEEDRIVLAYHELWQAGVDWRESNPHLGEHYSCEYAKQIKDADTLDFQEIANWIEGLTKRFHITEGLFDRWQGIAIEQDLVKKGLPHIRCEHFTRDVNSKMFQSAKMLMLSERLRLYDYPLPPAGSQAKHSPIISELLTLQAETVSKNIVVVQAPQQAGYHDDMSDALIRSIFLTAEKMANTKHVFRPLGHARGNVGPSLQGYQMQRARRHGMFTDRVNPRTLLRRR